MVSQNSLIKYIYKNGRFDLPSHRREASFIEIMKWQLGGSKAKWPRHVPNKAYTAPPARVDDNRIAATWIGHATVLLQTQGLNILTDPFFSKRASPTQLIGPSRVRNPGIALKNLPPIDLILLSHSHYDHMDKPALQWLAKNRAAKLITPLQNARHTNGFEVIDLDWHEAHSHGQAQITVLPALHWSKRTTRDTNRSLWGAFMVELPAGAIYFGADTGFGTGETFREVKHLFGSPRLSLLPIGAYEPRWFMAPQHMNPQESVTAHQILGSKKSFAIHHGTIQLTDEAIDAPVRELQVALKAAGLSANDFLVPDIGETVWID